MGTILQIPPATVSCPVAGPMALIGQAGAHPVRPNTLLPSSIALLCILVGGLNGVGKK